MSLGRLPPTTYAGKVAAFDGAGNASDQSSPPVVAATASNATGSCDDDLDDDGDGKLDWDGAGVGELNPQCVGTRRVRAGSQRIRVSSGRRSRFYSRFCTRFGVGADARGDIPVFLA